MVSMPISRLSWAAIVLAIARPSTALPSALATWAAGASAADLPAPATPCTTTILSSSDRISVAAPYVLPVATAAVIGGVRPGTGLAVDANGVLSATATAAATARTQRAITAAGTDTPTANEQFILALPAATGVVAITLLDALTQPITVVNRKTDASAANRVIRITPAAPTGGGTARTIESDPFLDLDAGYVLTLTPVGRDWIATGYPA